MCHAFDLEYKTRAVADPAARHLHHPRGRDGRRDRGERARQGPRLSWSGRALYRDNARGQIAGDADGLLKLVFARADRRLLGAHIVGERATELIHIASTGLALGGSIDTFIDAVFNFPTLSELYKYAAYDGLGRLDAAA